MSNILKVENLYKEYPLPKGRQCVLTALNFEIKKGELVAIMGASGVGKTTLLNLVSALDTPTQGKVFFEGEDLFAKDEKEKAQIRNKEIGFIFQFYHLLPEFTALENVCFPLLLRGVEKKKAFEKGYKVLREVFLEEKALIRPGQLSGGEQQRIAIARALINEPALLLADEPTGNLDWKTGEGILELVCKLHQKKGLSSIIVTHNDKVAHFCHKIYIMENGDLKLLSSL